MVLGERLELPMFVCLLTKEVQSPLCQPSELIPAPTPAEYRGFPSLNRESKPYPRNLQFLNSKSNREGRSTHTIIIPYEVLQVNLKKSIQINNLKKGRSFRCREGNDQQHLGTLSYQTSFGRRESRRNTFKLYSTISKKSTFSNKFYDQICLNKNSN